MMQTKDKKLAMLYFENESEIPKITGLLPAQEHKITWFNPITGEWLETKHIPSNEKGEIQLDFFPDNKEISQQDWSLKITL